MASTLKIHGVTEYPRKASPVGDRFRKPNLAAQLTAAGAVNVRSPATIPIRSETRSVVESMACIVTFLGRRLAVAPLPCRAVSSSLCASLCLTVESGRAKILGPYSRTPSRYGGGEAHVFSAT